MIDYARYEDVRCEDRLRHEVRLPRASRSEPDTSLLVDDLVGIEARGTSVTVGRLPPGVAERLAHHPLRRYTGFVPSDR